ncbi:MAG TPA: DUF2807 domain-containing protein [Ginsengibacter sp.]|nr:DUF2807 domain-containing protein [Ginsengibacter sp.]
MKTKSIIAILLICASISSIANPKSGADETFKTIPVISDYNKVSVGKNLSVVFINMPTSQAVIRGNSKSLENVDIKVVNGTLFVTAKLGIFLTSAIIYLPAKDLTEIDLQDDAKIHNEGVMECDNLTVYFSGGSYASLVTRGKVEFKPFGNIDLNVEEYPTLYGNVLKNN